MNCLLARPALAVNRRAGNFFREACGENGIASHIQALLARLDNTSYNNIFNLPGIDSDTINHGLEYLGKQVHRVPVFELPIAAPNRSANGINDNSFPHRHEKTS